MEIKRIKDLREDNDYTQEYIANYLEMQRAQYARYERGEREFKLNHIVKLAIFYNVSIDYILGLTNEKKPYPRTKKRPIRSFNFIHIMRF